MCQISILIIVTEIVSNLSKLMRINFIANDSVIDAQLAALPLGDKIQVKAPLDSNPEQSRKEANILAQKIFMLICDLINLPFDSDRDKESTQMASSSYIDLLSKTVLSIPNFVKSVIDANSDEMFRKAINRAEELQWNSIKNNLIICKSQIYDSPNITIQGRISNTYEYKLGDVTDSTNWSTMPTGPDTPDR